MMAELLGEMERLRAVLWTRVTTRRSRPQPKSVADRKPLAGVSRPLQFINQRDREVLKGNLALAVLPAEHRLAATRVVRDLGALPPDAILYLLAQPLLDLASDQLMPYRDLTTRYEGRFEVDDSAEWTAVMAEYNRDADAITASLFRAQGESGLAHLFFTDRRGFDRRMERGRQHFFGPPSGAHAAYLRSKGIID